MKTTARDSPDYKTNKTNISTYNRILKKSIRIAKCLYYYFCFNKYKKDIKKTLQTTNDIMHRKINSTSNPEYFEQNRINICVFYLGLNLDRFITFNIDTSL